MQLGSWSPVNPLPTLLSDSHPEYCGSRVVRWASFGDIKALAGELPMLSKRSYRTVCEQGIVVIVAAVIDREASALPNRRSQWAVALEPLSVLEVDELPVMPRKVVDLFEIRGFVEGDRDSEGFGDRSTMAQAKSCLQQHDRRGCISAKLKRFRV
jgi:hypothetical protein